MSDRYGARRPEGAFNGVTEDLDGTLSCSVVVDPDLVTTLFSEPVFPETQWTRQDRFFADVPAPRARLQDLVIYELHIGALGAGKRPPDKHLVIYELHIGALGAGKRPPDKPGTIEDAIALLDHLEDLGVNAIELLPPLFITGASRGIGLAIALRAARDGAAPYVCLARRPENVKIYAGSGIIWGIPLQMRVHDYSCFAGGQCRWT